MLANEKLGIANLLRIVRGQDITAGIAKDRLSSAENIATARHSITKRGQDIRKDISEAGQLLTERGQDIRKELGDLNILLRGKGLSLESLKLDNLDKYRAGSLDLEKTKIDDLESHRRTLEEIKYIELELKEEGLDLQSAGLENLKQYRDKLTENQEQERLRRNDIVRAEAALGGDGSPLDERESAPYITILHEKASDDQTYGYAYTTKGTNGTRRVNLVFEGQTMTMGEVRLAAKKLGVSVNAYIKEFAELSGQ